MKQKFIDIISTQAKNNFIRVVLTTSLLSAICIIALTFGIMAQFFPLILVSIILITTISVMYYRFKGDFRGSKFWLNVFQNKPEEIIWIKPVIIKYTVGFIITLDEQKHFIVYTQGGYGMTLKFDDMEDQKRFFRNVRMYCPDAQFGYTEQVKAMYDEFKDTPYFIEALQKRNIHTPISTFYS